MNRTTVIISFGIGLIVVGIIAAFNNNSLIFVSVISGIFGVWLICMGLEVETKNRTNDDIREDLQKQGYTYVASELSDDEPNSAVATIERNGKFESFDLKKIGGFWCVGKKTRGGFVQLDAPRTTEQLGYIPDAPRLDP